MAQALAIPASDWHARYRAINRAAGIVAGYTFSREGESAPFVAQRIVNLVIERFARGERPDVPALTGGDDRAAWERQERVKLLDGLVERVAHTLVEMGA